MGEGFTASGFVQSDPLPVGRRHDEPELVVAGLRHAEEGAAPELDRFGVPRGLENAFVRAPLDMDAAAGVNEVDPLFTEVREIETVEIIAAQFEDAFDGLSAEIDDLEPAI